ncbi:RusA family crossover junction endodeoxyribonuclease [Lysinibacillus sp. UGB7]|uniref:RusA family crossover junction endodeoxyribonuclease n=1 Tax=Lysinibacillus sp. UGB7 TaxID=3411039 RepID=UPI003B8073C1
MYINHFKRCISKLLKARYDLQPIRNIDNLAKGIKDGLSKVLCQDDNSTEVVACKFYSDNLRAAVTIEWAQQ